MKRANGVLTEGKLGSFPSFSLGLLEVASERRAVPICPGPDAASQAPSSPLGSLCVSRDSPSRPTRPIQGLQGPSRVQPWTLHRTSHPRVPGGLRTDRGLTEALPGHLEGRRCVSLDVKGHTTPSNCYQTCARAAYFRDLQGQRKQLLSAQQLHPGVTLPSSVCLLNFTSTEQ